MCFFPQKLRENVEPFAARRLGQLAAAGWRPIYSPPSPSPLHSAMHGGQHGQHNTHGAQVVPEERLVMVKGQQKAQRPWQKLLPSIDHWEMVALYFQCNTHAAITPQHRTSTHTPDILLSTETCPPRPTPNTKHHRRRRSSIVDHPSPLLPPPPLLLPFSLSFFSQTARSSFSSTSDGRQQHSPSSPGCASLCGTSGSRLRVLTSSTFGRTFW